jgi:NADPH:quinone reductase-like Zn-dependent oxidoreductase
MISRPLHSSLGSRALCLATKPIQSIWRTQTSPATTPRSSDDHNRAWRLQQLNRSSLTLDGDLARPVIRRPNQLLVQVHASSVNPIDVLLADGYGNRFFEAIHVLDSCRDSRITYDRFPLTLGRDFAGVVIATGSDVKHVTVGDHVWGAVSPWMSGSHTDLLLTDSCHVGTAPKTIPLEEAAAIPYSALTVWSSLEAAQLNSTNAPRQRYHFGSLIVLSRIIY